MAMADYHTCDCCGNAKTFYDANIFDYYAVKDGYPSGLYGAADLAALCSECVKTHEIKIVERSRPAPTPRRTRCEIVDALIGTAGMEPWEAIIVAQQQKSKGEF